MSKKFDYLKVRILNVTVKLGVNEQLGVKSSRYRQNQKKENTCQDRTQHQTQLMFAPPETKF